MRLPRFTRKQRILRNLLLIALFLYWAAWYLEFPCLTKNGLLRRAEDAYLLEKGDVELLFDGRDIGEESLYAAYGEQLMMLGHDRTLLGVRPAGRRLYAPEKRQLLDIDLEMREERGTTYYYPTGTLVGFLEDAETAELEMTVALDDTRSVTFRMPGTKVDPCCFTFAYERQFSPEEDSEAARLEEELLLANYPWEYSAILKLFDQNGTLLESHTYEKLWYGIN